MDPQWLDSEEQAAWRRIVGLVTALPTALEGQLQRDSGLTHFEYWVLSALSEAPSTPCAWAAWPTRPTGRSRACPTWPGGWNGAEC